MFGGRREHLRQRSRHEARRVQMTTIAAASPPTRRPPCARRAAPRRRAPRQQVEQDPVGLHDRARWCVDQMADTQRPATEHRERGDPGEGRRPSPANGRAANAIRRASTAAATAVATPTVPTKKPPEWKASATAPAAGAPSTVSWPHPNPDGVVASRSVASAADAVRGRRRSRRPLVVTPPPRTRRSRRRALRRGPGERGSSVACLPVALGPRAGGVRHRTLAPVSQGNRRRSRGVAVGVPLAGGRAASRPGTGQGSNPAPAPASAADRGRRPAAGRVRPGPVRWTAAVPRKTPPFRRSRGAAAARTGPRRRHVGIRAGASRVWEQAAKALGSHRLRKHLRTPDAPHGCRCAKRASCQVSNLRASAVLFPVIRQVDKRMNQDQTGPPVRFNGHWR